VTKDIGGRGKRGWEGVLLLPPTYSPTGAHGAVGWTTEEWGSMLSDGRETFYYRFKNGSEVHTTLVPEQFLAEVKKACSHTSTLPHVFVPYLMQHKDGLTLTLI
jgi:hypothetical protein